MKKFICILLSALMLLSLAACSGDSDTGKRGGQSAGKDDTKAPGKMDDSEYFEWSQDYGDEGKIIGLTEAGKKQTALVIPADCIQIRGINDNDTLKKLTFANPDTVIRLGAFMRCTALEYVELPANLTKIDESLFYECTSLKTVIIPEGVTSIGTSAFGNCKSLEEITLPSTLTSIDTEAFIRCESLKSISIPDSVTEVGMRAFERCDSLASAKLSAGMTVVREQTFYQAGLVSIEVPEGTTELEEDAFSYCASLQDLYLPRSIEKVDATSFIEGQTFNVHIYQDSYLDSVVGDMNGSEMMNIVYR